MSHVFRTFQSMIVIISRTVRYTRHVPYRVPRLSLTFVPGGRGKCGCREVRACGAGGVVGWMDGWMVRLCGVGKEGDAGGIWGVAFGGERGRDRNALDFLSLLP